MTNKLYVANVPVDASEDALRRHFAACGGVLDVEIMLERNSGKSRGLACVTMTSPAYATAALGLNGVDFAGKQLQVSDAPIRAGGKPVPTVKIVQQFRERTNMTYDLDCSGLPLTLRVFPTDPEGTQWRIEARSTDAVDAVVITGAGVTRRDALTEVVRVWNEREATSTVRPLDGEALMTAMRDVRAV